ncbi:hypothetical protein ACLB2K_065321 [Fragaria x ananassa]
MEGDEDDVERIWSWLALDVEKTEVVKEWGHGAADLKRVEGERERDLDVVFSFKGDGQMAVSESVRPVRDPLPAPRALLQNSSSSPVTSVASADSSVRKRIRRAANTDVSHLKIFVHDLGWDTTREVFVSAFEPFGEVEDSNLVMDKLTGKAKGNGFVLFKTRRAAFKALREPKKTIGNHCASCQLAFVGLDTNTNTNVAAPPSESWSSRKIQGGAPLLEIILL